jgi:Flp pilus assembly pilin Flp
VLRLVAFLQASTADALRREEGQTMAEYGVVLAVITLAVIGAITLLSSHVRDAITNDGAAGRRGLFVASEELVRLSTVCELPFGLS